MRFLLLNTFMQPPPTNTPIIGMSDIPLHMPARLGHSGGERGSRVRSSKTLQGVRSGYSRIMQLSFLFIILSLSITSPAQPTTDSLLKEILEKNNDPIFQKVLNDPQTY